MTNVLISVKNNKFAIKMITDRLIALGASLSNRPTSCLYVGINDSNQVVYTNAVEGLSVEVDVVDVMTAPSLEALSEFAC